MVYYSDEAIRVITEMKRVAKPSGLVASHDLSALHFFPNHLYQLDDLVERTLFKAAGMKGWYGAIMPELYHRIGFKEYKLACTASPTQAKPGK